METVYIGGETHILVAARSGDQIVVRQSVPVGPRPSFLAFAPARKLLVTVLEEADQLVSLRVAANGDLTPLKTVSCPGGPAYVAIDKSEEFVASASYRSGEVRTYRLAPDGTLSAVSEVQTGKNAHSVVFSPDNRRVFVANKGSDSLSVLSFDPESGELSEPETVKARDGSGPRHLAFSRSGHELYLVGENDCSLSLWKANDDLRELSSHTTLPRPLTPSDTGADLHPSGCGRFVYVSNRGHDSISLFGVSPDGLQYLGNESTRGLIPRNFSLLGTDYLLVANERSKTLALFSRHPETGELSFLSSSSLPERPVWVGPGRISDAS